MHRRCISIGLFFLISLTLRAASPVVAGCPSLPADNIWNTPVDQLPVHARSADYVNSMGPGTRIHADFGSGYWNYGVPFGLLWTTVPGTQTKVPVTFDIAGESDPGPYPI